MSAMKIMLMLHKGIRSKGKCHIAFKMSLLWNEWPKFFLQATFGAHDVVTQHHFSLLITQDKLTNSTQRLLFYATDTHIHTLIPKPFFTGSKAKQKKKASNTQSGCGFTATADIFQSWPEGLFQWATQLRSQTDDVSAQHGGHSGNYWRARLVWDRYIEPCCTHAACQLKLWRSGALTHVLRRCVFI